MSLNQNTHLAILGSEPYYTSEDVAILHRIVSYADEQLSELPEGQRIPTNALFNSYFTILPQLGINPDHDCRYARVLFMIGGRRDDEGTLYEKFENALAQLGIDLEFDVIEENSVNGSRLPIGESSPFLSDTHAHAAIGNSTVLERHRRNSETAAWPAGFGRIDQTRPRARSSSPHYTRPTPVQRAGHHNGVLPIRQRQADIGSPNRRSSEQRSKEIESRMSSRLHGVDKHHNHGPIKFDFLNPTAPHETYYGDEGQTARDSRAGHLDADEPQGQSILDQSPHHEKAESSGLDDWTGETDEFNIERVRSRHDTASLRHIMSKWHEQASSKQHHSAQQWAIAERQDRLMLLRPAFDAWRSRFLQRQQEREEERIQIEQEAEAVHARETYLQHKYFTRWASVTAEERERVNAAYDRILTLRLFNAWRDHIASDNLKARQHVQRKFLNIWRAKRADNAEIERLSIRVYEINLVKRVFWAWFWEFCEKRAPGFWQDTVKTQNIETWRLKASILQINLVIAEEALRVKTQKAPFYAWVERCRIHKEMEIAATEQYEKKRKQQALVLWRSQTQLQAAKKEADEKIENILKRTVLSRWRLRTKQEQDATSFSNLRILKGALLTWQHQFKAKQLEKERQRRAFQAWRLAVQLKKANRISREKLLRKFMPRLVNTTRQAVVTTNFLTTHAEDVHSHYLAKWAFRKWRERLAQVKALSQLALNMRPAPIVKDCLTKWIAAKRKTDQMGKWAADAQFYVVGRRVLGYWRKATQASKKEKRKIAYAQARRWNKMRLAKLALDKWRHRAGEVRELDAIAVNARENKTQALASKALVVWRAKSQDITELNDFADLSRPRKALSAWRDRLAQADRDMAIAEESNNMRLQVRCLKKWSRAALQIRAHEHLVSELLEKRARKSLRLVFNHWRQAAETRRNARLLFDTKTPSIPRPVAAGAAASGSHRQVETLINLNESVLQSPAKPHIKDLSPMKATPLPAYLSTPSRRSTLARSVAAGGSTTPAGTPIVPAPVFGRSTPFERQLRAQSSGNTLSAYTRRTQTRPLSKLRAFDDLVEEARGDDEEELVGEAKGDDEEELVEGARGDDEEELVEGARGDDDEDV